MPTTVPGLPQDTVRMPICWFRPADEKGGEGRERFGLHRFPEFMREVDGGQVLWGNGRENSRLTGFKKRG
ncbi:hypothetical protein [Streptomyces sp. MMG1533]|uniref:hypothetical protein n=1 Tax=Streptomyces sp. MMG1533 TaxID=1415546 RepID=UPI0018FEB785|nr:hypothetical protein [Streptomyces sp. MMG1533]